MKKPTAVLAFSLSMLASATAFACPKANGPFEEAALVGLFTSVLWVPLSLLTIAALFFLRKRFARRRGLVFSMLGAVPFSAASVIGMLYLGFRVLEPALRQHSLVLAAVAGCVTALNAGYVAFCHQVARRHS